MNKNALLKKYSKKFANYRLEFLTKEITNKYVEELLTLIDQIPKVNYTKEEILAESKDDGKRVFYGKWEHSLILFDKDEIMGVIISYEKEKEENKMYPKNTLCLSELAVSKKYQRKGIAKKLLDVYLKINKEIGFIYLDGDFNYSVQTNSAKWNNHVARLYRGFGYKKRAEKKYDNRTYLILGLDPEIKYFVYIVECRGGSFYCGYTNNLDRRAREHNESKNGAFYTKNKRPVRLIYFEEYKTIREAMKRESEIKKLKRKEKEELIGKI